MSVLSADTIPTSNNPIKNYCFTVHYDELPELPTSLPDGCVYIVFQRECCPSTKRQHLQGYVQLSSKLRFKQAKQYIAGLFPSSRQLSPYIAVARGNPKQNRDYCTKSESRAPDTDPVEFGTISLPGARNDLSFVRDAIISGVSPSDAISSDDSFTASTLRYYRSWKSVMADLAPQRDASVDPQVIVIYGVPGSGKTRYAYDKYPGAYMKSTGKWWDFYNGQEVVIYDDFDGWDCTFANFKTWTDRYPCFVESKGSTVKLAATVHIFTTNTYPSHWWTKKVTGAYGRDAIWRRITSVIHYPYVGEDPIVYEPKDFRALPECSLLEMQDPKRRDE